MGAVFALALRKRLRNLIDRLVYVEVLQIIAPCKIIYSRWFVYSLIYINLVDYPNASQISPAAPKVSTKTPFTNLPKARARVPSARMELMLELSSPKHAKGISM